jgi:arylsulfatase A-like enzyme
VTIASKIQSLSEGDKIVHPVREAVPAMEDAGVPAATRSAPLAGETASSLPVKTPPLRRVVRLSMTGARVAVGAALGLWLGDALLLGITRSGATWGQWAQGIGAAAFVSISTALVFGLLLGPMLVPPIRSLVHASIDGLRALRRGEIDARHTFVASVLALAVLLALWGEVTYHVVLAIVYGVSRPENMAFGMTAADMALAAILLISWPSAVRAGRIVVDGCSRVRRLRWLVKRAWPVPALVALPFLSVATIVIVIERSQLAALPWHEMVPLVGLLLGAGVAAALPVAPARFTRGVFGFVALVFAFGFAEAMSLRPESSTAQSLGFDRALSGRAGYAAWTLALDFDRDGQISVLGGGDCAPFDPKRYTGAPDIPGNGIDEDCDGADASPEWLRPRPPPALPPGTVPAAATVILVTVDALAAPELSALGSPRPIMPRVDQLAKRSMLFSRCFSQGPSTRLSFPSIFTSTWDSEQTFTYSSRLPYSFAPEARTLQEAFLDAGYNTVAVIPNEYFDHWMWASITKGFQHVDTTALRSFSGHSNAQEVTDAALRILSEQRDRPLYMWVHYFDAHPPYGVPPGVAPPPVRDDRTLYEEELGYIDRQLGRLFDAIDGRSVATYPTILVLSSDHATSFHPVPESRHFHYGYDIYTSTLHVPLIFHGPGLQIGRDDDVVSTMDIAPTLANLLRLNDQGRFEGTSLAWELVKGIDDPKRVLFHEFYLPENIFRGSGDPLEFVSARSNRYDLILNRKRGTYELYDWPVDYYEQRDVYEERARAPEVTHLKSLLGAFVQQKSRREPISAAPASKLADAWSSFFTPKPRAVQR